MTWLVLPRTRGWCSHKVGHKSHHFITPNPMRQSWKFKHMYRKRIKRDISFRSPCFAITGEKKDKHIYFHIRSFYRVARKIAKDCGFMRMTGGAVTMLLMHTMGEIDHMLAIEYRGRLVVANEELQAMLIIGDMLGLSLVD